MKIVNRSYKDLDESIRVIGIENVKFEDLEVIVNKINTDRLQQLVGTIPDNIGTKNKLDHVAIDNLIFAKCEVVLSCVSNVNNIEDIIILNLDPNFKVRGNKISINNDPYFRIKNLCLDKKSFVLFYSPVDKDLEIFIHKTLLEKVARKLGY